jgi:hypothetical protein
MVGPIAVIGSIVWEQFLGPCEPIDRMSQAQDWAHSLSSAILCAMSFWAHVSLSANCLGGKGGPIH